MCFVCAFVRAEVEVQEVEEEWKRWKVLGVCVWAGKRCGREHAFASIEHSTRGNGFLGDYEHTQTLTHKPKSTSWRAGGELSDDGVGVERCEEGRKRDRE